MHKSLLLIAFFLQLLLLPQTALCDGYFASKMTSRTVRFAPNVDTTTRNVRQRTASDMAPMPSINPLIAAECHINSSTTSLQSGIANLLRSLGKKHLLLAQTHHQRQRRVEQMESDSSYQPISTRFSSFKIKASDDVKDLEDFKSIQEEADEAIATLRSKLQDQVIACAKLEAKTALSAVQKSMMEAIMHTVAIFYVEAKTEETSAPGIAYHMIKSCDKAITKYLSLTNAQLLSLFAAEYNISATPDELSTEHERIRVKAGSAILSAFVNSWSTYLQQEDSNDIAIKINKKAKSILTTKATDDSAIKLDSEESVSRENLEELISKRTAAEVKRQMNAFKSSLKDGGSDGSSARKNKKETKKGKGKGKKKKPTKIPTISAKARSKRRKKIPSSSRIRKETANRKRRPNRQRSQEGNKTLLWLCV